MTLILVYLVVLILVAVVLFGVGSVLFGRGEVLPPLPRATTATVLPASGVTGADVDSVKFTQVLRGYKTSEVDWVLDRLGAGARPATRRTGGGPGGTRVSGGDAGEEEPDEGGAHALPSEDRTDS